MEANYNFRAVVVLYHPDNGAINMVQGIALDGYAPVVVSNAICPEKLAVLSEAGIEVVVNAENAGLSAAFNQGIERALASGADYVMLLDQDSRPASDMAGSLLSLATLIKMSGRRLGCIGPVPVDRKRPKALTLAREVSRRKDRKFAEVITIISSGMIIPRTALEAVGGMWNELFIDHIDHEWCFRARAAGLGVFAATSVPMPHDMGDEGIVVLGRYKPIHRSPVRHFYIVRNTLWLLRCSFIPKLWRAKETLKLTTRIASYLLFSSDRDATRRAILMALRAGLRGPAERTFSAPKS